MCALFYKSKISNKIKKSNQDTSTMDNQNSALGLSRLETSSSAEDYLHNACSEPRLTHSTDLKHIYPLPEGRQSNYLEFNQHQRRH